MKKHYCKICQTVQLETNFYIDKRRGTPRGRVCKKCSTMVSSFYRRFKNYGITEKEYWKLLNEQNGRCFICNKMPKNKTLAVDHCHKTGKVRRLLCDACNKYIGYIEENIQTAKNVVSYLEKFKIN